MLFILINQSVICSSI